MAKTKAAKPVEEEVKQPEATEAAPATTEVAEKATPAPKAKKGEPISVTYRDHKGEPTTRVFSKEDHGEDFAGVAEQFKKTNADKLL
jgi:hypothetical protein